VLLKEFIEPKRLTRYRNAGSTRFARGTALSAGTALRLARLFGVEAQFWMNFQARYLYSRGARAAQARQDTRAALRSRVY
jgi:plasmid maintenance system antidote protein VapI